MPRNSSATIPYKVQMGDTLPRIAIRTLGDSSRWTDIAFFNALNPPFIANYKDVSGAQKTTGPVVFYLDAPPVSDILIPQGTIVGTTPQKMFGGGESEHQLIYETLSEAYLTTTAFEITLVVRAISFGVEYNIRAGKITTLNDANLVDLGVQVRNDENFTTGTSTKVATPGDVIFIPLDLRSDTNTYQNRVTDIVSLDEWQDRVLGTDIRLIQAGAFNIQDLNQIVNDIRVDDKGDILTVTGIRNLAQTTQHRLSTQRGDVLGAPEFGSMFAYMVGTNTELATRKFLSLEAKQTLQKDPRVVAVLSVEVIQGSGGAFIINSICLVLGRDDPQELNQVMPPSV